MLEFPRRKLTNQEAREFFSISPIEFTLATKRYYGHFQAAYQNARPTSQTAIGINPNGPEWNTLVRYLGEVGLDHIITGDYKSFGDCLQSECLIAAFNVMIDWYRFYFKLDELQLTAMETIRDELIHVPHVCEHEVYQMLCGLPSGFALTVELNSLVNCLYMRICWLMIMEGTEHESLAQYAKHTRLVTYGDDLIKSVSAIVKDRFNFISIKTILEAHSIKFTSATKDENDITPFVSLHDATFLKRGFRKHEFNTGWWMAPLEWDSIVDCVNWVHSSNDPRALAITNSKAAIEGAYCLGKQSYERVRCAIIEWWARKRNEVLDVPLWDEVDARVWDTRGMRFNRFSILFNKQD